VTVLERRAQHRAFIARLRIQEAVEKAKPSEATLRKRASRERTGRN